MLYFVFLSIDKIVLSMLLYNKYNMNGGSCNVLKLTNSTKLIQGEYLEYIIIRNLQRQFFYYLAEGYSYDYAYDYALRDVSDTYSGESGAVSFVSYPSNHIG